MMNPKISIIVPVFNTELYLERCINSIISQNIIEIQIILIDDGSTDNSKMICEKFASIDDRVNYFRIENSGPSFARNFGVDKATGKYIMFVDSDDWLENGACSSLFQAAEDNNADFVIGSHVNESSSGSTVRHIFSEKTVFRDENYKNEVLLPTLGLVGARIKNIDKIDRLTPIWARLYKLSIIKDKDVRFLDLKKVPSECLQFNFDFCVHACSAVYIDDVVYHYRRNTGMSVTKPYRPDLLSKWQWWSDYFRAKYHTLLDDEMFANAFRVRICSSIIPLGGNAVKLKKTRLIKQECKTFLNDANVSQALKETNFKWCLFYWRLFFYSAKKRQLNNFIILTKAMRMLLNRRKK